MKSDEEKDIEVIADSVIGYFEDNRQRDKRNGSDLNFCDDDVEHEVHRKVKRFIEEKYLK